MDIAGFGEKLVERFVELGMIVDVADLYRLDWDRVAELERLGEKSATNLRISVERSKQRPLARLVFALGIRHIGERAAALLAERFGSLDALAAASLDHINAVPGIGPVLAQSAHDFFQENHNRALIAKLTEAGVRTAEESAGERRNGPGPLAGKSVVLTGRLETMTRPKAEELLRRAGAAVAGSVSKRTAFVVAGEDAGSKAERAKELGVAILTEAELLLMLDGDQEENVAGSSSSRLPDERPEGVEAAPNVSAKG